MKQLLLLLGAVAALAWQERRRPLRTRVEPDLPHGLRNVALAGIGALATFACESPVIQPLARQVQRRHLGLTGWLRLPPGVAPIVALILMDYTFYLWHILLHRVPFLWRFHAIHHIDLDLDSSTALRFHFGELLLSIPWRAAQVRLIGLNPTTFVLWQTWFALCVLFHHSNLRLPEVWERRLNLLLVTPRMHGIHHSNRRAHTDSNWSSGLTVWDHLHGTLRLDVPQTAIEIGVPPIHAPHPAPLPQALALPFGQQPPYWQ